MMASGSVVPAAEEVEEEEGAEATAERGERRRLRGAEDANVARQGGAWCLMAASPLVAVGGVGRSKGVGKRKALVGAASVSARMHVVEERRGPREVADAAKGPGVE